MVRAASRLSQVIIGSLLLSNTAFAYPIEQFGSAGEKMIQSNRLRRQSVILDRSTRKQRMQVQETSTEQMTPVRRPVRAQETPKKIEVPLSFQHVTRAQFVRATIDGLYPDGIPSDCYDRLSPSEYWLLFSDVPTDVSYGPQLCAAMVKGFIDGYSDGTFRPHKAINVAEAAKILSKAYNLANDTVDRDAEWFTPYVESLRAHGAIPSYVKLDDPVTPETMLFMVQIISQAER